MNDRSEKNQPAYIEMSMLADRIIKMMDECGSTYAPAKKHVTEARRSVMLQPGHAVREMRKAFALVEDEFLLVSEFRRCEASFPVNVKMSSVGGVSDITAKFRSLVRSGEFKKAEKQLNELKMLMDNNGVTANIALSTTDNVVKDGKVRIRLTNIGEKDITVDRISVNCLDASLKKTSPLIRTIKRGASSEFDAEFEGEPGDVNTISVSVGYQVDMNEFSETMYIKVFSERKEEEE